MIVLQRIVFGVLMLGGVFAVLWGDHERGDFGGLAVLLLVVVALVLSEYTALLARAGQPLTALFVVGGGVAVYLEGAWRLGAFAPWGWPFAGGGLALHVAAALPLSALLLVPLFALDAIRRFDNRAFARAGLSMFGALILPALFVAALALRALPDRGLNTGLSTGEALLLLVLVCSRFGDIAAFFVGRAIGKRRLIPRISPGKSVEGAIAGLCMSAGCALAVTRLWLPEFSTASALAFGLVVGAAAQVGDLLESVLKRNAGAKDSGRLVPQFGGALDLVDNFLVSVPAAWICLFLTRPSV